MSPRSTWSTSTFTTGTFMTTFMFGALVVYHHRRVQLEKRRLERETRTLEEQVQKQMALRQAERKGRIAAEKKLSQFLAKLPQKSATRTKRDEGCVVFEPIGHMKSSFIDRRGTPRQGLFSPSIKGLIQLQNHISPTTLCGLDDFSHIWVLFIFHENTNAVGRATKSTFPAKIKPPRLNHKVGIFSTRTPHRPNNIGMSLLKIEHVSTSRNEIMVTGHDLVDGTPILDIKPYVPYDALSSDMIVCPEWIRSSPKDKLPKVWFHPRAVQEMQEIIRTGQVDFYSTLEELQQVLTEVLVLDIRSRHQHRGETDEDVSMRYNLRFDQLSLYFQTLEDGVHVETCEWIKR